jgi:4-amino-4-deoxy-L-arabinose transferase-like glycosyltransferase
LGIALAALVGLAVRVARVALVTGRQPVQHDSFYYYWQAREVNAGHGFAQVFGIIQFGQWVPGADHPPGYVTLLIVLQRLHLESPMSERYFMAFLGTATVVLIGLIARRLLGGRAGVVAALIAAVYPNLWVNDAEIMSEGLFVFAFTLSVYSVFRFRSDRSWRWLVVLAIALTVASSARPESLLLFVLVLVPAVLGASGLGWRRRIAMVGVAALIPIAVFLPWTIYNMGRFSKPVYLSTGFGQTLLQGNCGITYQGKTLGYYSLGCLRNVLPPSNGKPPDASVNDALYRKRAFHNMMTNKRRLPGVVLAREGRIWGVYRVRQQAGLDRYLEGRGSKFVVHWQQRSWWLVALLALPGFWLWRRRGNVLYPLVAQIEVTALITAITFGNTRYRAGVEVVVVLLATATIDCVIGWVWRRFRPDGSQAEPVGVGASHEPSVV